QIAPLQLPCQLVGRSPRKGKDGERGVLVAGSGEGGCIRNKDVFYFVHLAKAIQGRAFGVVAQTTSGMLVDGAAVAIDGSTGVGQRFDFASGEDGLDDIVHFLDHGAFVFANLETNVGDWDAVGV